MKKFKWIFWIVLIALVGAGIWYWKFRKEEQLVVLQTEKPQYGQIATTITATGTVQPVDTVAVGTRVSGTIQKVYVDFNDKVKKGELLAQLDKSLLLADVQQATANLQQAQSNLAYQQSNYERQNQLYQLGAISKADYETALNTWSTAKDAVQSASAQLKSAQQNLSYADIYSPIDGTVLSRNVSEGQTVAASFSTPTLFSIAKDLTKMQVRAAVDEADIGNVKKGQRATFTVDAFPDDVFNGTVKEVRLQPSVSSNVVTYVTIVDAPNNDLKLKPGMTATIIVYTKEVPDALLISSKAVNFKPDSTIAKTYAIEPFHRRAGVPGTRPGRDSMVHPVASVHDSLATSGSGKMATVWVKEDSSLVAHRIETGLNDETQVQVLKGLTPDDMVVTGYQQLTKKEAKSANAERSPFLPQRPGGNRKRNNPGPPPQ